ncbi:MAG: hypothetical protein RRY33_03175 [Alistipes sp.]
MKLCKWLRARTLTEWMMLVVIITLLIMIATRWATISQSAGQAIKNRFVPTEEKQN